VFHAKKSWLVLFEGLFVCIFSCFIVQNRLKSGVNGQHWLEFKHHPTWQIISKVTIALWLSTSWNVGSINDVLPSCTWVKWKWISSWWNNQLLHMHCIASQVEKLVTWSPYENLGKGWAFGEILWVTTCFRSSSHGQVWLTT